MANTSTHLVYYATQPLLVQVAEGTPIADGKPFYLGSRILMMSSVGPRSLPWNEDGNDKLAPIAFTLSDRYSEGLGKLLRLWKVYEPMRNDATARKATLIELVREANKIGTDIGDEMVPPYSKGSDVTPETKDATEVERLIKHLETRATLPVEYARPYNG